MKRKALLICIIFCLPFFATSLFAETDILGWGKTKWGMTQSEVAKIYDLGDCKDVSQASRILVEKYNIRPEYQLKDTIKIEHNEFEVTFFFDNCSPSGKLSGVTLLAVSAEPPFDGILNILIGKYGTPESTNVRSTFRTIERWWFRPSGKLFFSHSLKGENGQCGLYYNTTSPDSDKL
jgi:hypothetical protein